MILKKNIELENIIYANNINQEGPCHLKISNYTEYFKGKYSQKADSPDICGFYKALFFLSKNCYIRNFLKKLGRDALDVRYLKYLIITFLYSFKKNDEKKIELISN